ncbi:hypothetical protein BCR33DRAFT_572543 [Rhizoclosmatium globosum]|uniref:Uncharacterized protein n=1 Tax=Rhizoclosmatium globosum TaxID=329046 RepID=A0A1Y2B757_9FUNG|nr:hypothetical protein BCR33DRAFT_572543 [Rhizoclosmatium globosum]|eukprot:ORY29935.1 hypothetical protein BCR33DRAFT_572543 [Rhizoclosmatium globosum]
MHDHPASHKITRIQVIVLRLFLILLLFCLLFNIKWMFDPQSSNLLEVTKRAIIFLFCTFAMKTQQLQMKRLGSLGDIETVLSCLPLPTLGQPIHLFSPTCSVLW